MRETTLSVLLLALALFTPVVSLTSSRPGLTKPSSQIRYSTAIEASVTDGVSIKFSATSLKHLENTELPDDYSRPWSETKIRALAAGMGLGAILGIGGEVLCQSLLDIEKTSVLWGAVGIGAGWYLGGGQQVAEDEKPINGGYDRKLIADRPARMKSVLDFLKGKDIPLELSTNDDDVRDLKEVMDLINVVHTEQYVAMLSSKTEQADRPQRLNPVYSRTLIDQHSFDASVNAVADWMDSVDAAIDGRPKFALVRPPSHHACRGKGMGGCLLNSASIAAVYASKVLKGASVAILDIDAHHGNGIAHCIQDLPNIRYCSIHESTASAFLGRSKGDPADPRSAESDDQGPLGNILNVNLPANTGWENGYREALTKTALPFLKETKPDILLVAAGFDALDADLTSKLKLKPQDYNSIGVILREEFGNRVAFGLEGGYCWQDGELQDAIFNFVDAWR
jgi:acetoin utilization deacetylase AcuC-like enzyme